MEDAMKSSLIAFCLIFFLFAAPQARSQVTVDASKITCDQFVLGKIGASARTVTDWLSGYYNGKRGTTIINVGAKEKNTRALSAYCRKHREALVMDAAKIVLGVE